MELTKQKSYILPKAMMFALFFMIAFVTGLQHLRGVIVKDQSGVSNGTAELRNFADFLAYAGMGIPADLLRQQGFLSASCS